MDARRSPAPRSTRAAWPTWPRSTALTFTHRADLALAARATTRLPRGAGVSHPRRRLRPWRPAARDSRWADAARAGASCWRASTSIRAARALAAAATPAEHGDRLAHRRRVRLRARPTAGLHRQLAVRASSDRRGRSCDSLRWLDAACRRAAGSSPICTAIALAYYGFPAAGPRGGLAPHRASGRRRSRSPARSAAPNGQALLAAGRDRAAEVRWRLPFRYTRRAPEMTRPASPAAAWPGPRPPACWRAPGARVTVIEREAAPADKICGEFVSAEAQHYLRHLGIDLAALGGRADRRVPAGARRAVVSSRGCRSPGSACRAACWTRRCCAAPPMRRASVGADRRCALSGRGLDRSRGRWRDAQADTLFLATGKHDLRGLRRATADAPDIWSASSCTSGCREAQRAALAGHVEIVLLADGYAGLQLVEDGMANLCLLVERSGCARRRRLGRRCWTICSAASRICATRLAGAVGHAEAAAVDLPRALRLRASAGARRSARRLSAGRPDGRDPVVHRRRHVDRAAQRRGRRRGLPRRRTAALITAASAATSRARSAAPARSTGSAARRRCSRR